MSTGPTLTPYAYATENGLRLRPEGHEPVPLVRMEDAEAAIKGLRDALERAEGMVTFLSGEQGPMEERLREATHRLGLAVGVAQTLAREVTLPPPSRLTPGTWQYGTSAVALGQWHLIHPDPETP